MSDYTSHDVREWQDVCEFLQKARIVSGCHFADDLIALAIDRIDCKESGGLGDVAHPRDEIRRAAIAEHLVAANEAHEEGAEWVKDKYRCALCTNRETLVSGYEDERFSDCDHESMSDAWHAAASRFLDDHGLDYHNSSTFSDWHGGAHYQCGSHLPGYKCGWIACHGDLIPDRIREIIDGASAAGDEALHASYLLSLESADEFEAENEDEDEDEDAAE